MKRYREMPKNLKIALALSGRKFFTENERWQYKNELKGFTQGECPFDQFTCKLNSDIKVLNDITLSDGKTCQLDTLIVTDQEIFLLDMKFYNGPLSFENGRIFVNGNMTVNDPLHQLDRAKNLLESKLAYYKLNIPVTAKLVFMNPNMVFYGNNPDLPILLYPQIDGFLDEICVWDSQHTEKIARLLLSFDSEENPYEIVHRIKYDYESLRKGIRCEKCNSLDLNINFRDYTCITCNFKDSKRNGLIRSINDLKLLFPDNKITPRLVFDWTNGQVSKKSIGKLLNSELRDDFLK